MANDVTIRVGVDADGRPVLELIGGVDRLGAAADKAGGRARNLGAQLNATGAQAKQAETAFSGFVSTLLKTDIGRTIAGYFGVQAVIGFTTSLKDASIQYERTIRTLEFATGSAEGAGKAYEFARGEATRLGVTVSSVAESYSKFAAAAKGTAVSSEDVRTVFTGIISASRALGLATTDVDRTFRAFTQIIAKGKVTAEEFRGQIGDALPVATLAAAEALGVTTTEFSRMLDAGELTLDFLPKLGAELQKQFGGIAATATNTLSGSISRLENSWNALQLTLAESGGVTAAVASLNYLSEVVQSAKALIDSLGRAWKRENLIQNNEEFRDVAKGATDEIAKIDALLAGGAPATEGILRRRDAMVLLKNSIIETAKEERGLERSREESKAQANLVPGRSGIKTRAVLAGEDTKLLPVQSGRRAFLALEGERQNLDALQKIRDAADKEAEQKAKAAAKKSDTLRKSEARKAEAEAKRQADAVKSASVALLEQAGAANIQTAALRLGGKEGARYATVQTETAKILASTVPLTEKLKAEIENLANAEAALAAQQKEVEASSFLDSIKEQTEAVNLEIEALRIGGAEGLRYATVQRETAAAIADDLEITKELTAEINNLADAQAAAFESREFIQAQKEAQEDLKREFERTSESLTTSITDALLRGFENGKSLAENFKDTLVNLFKTLILRPTIEFLVRPIADLAQQVTRSVLGGAFVGGEGSGFGSLLGVGSTALGLLGSQGAAPAGFAGQAVPTLAGDAGLFSGTAGIGSVAGILSSLATSLSTPAIGAQAAIIAQEAIGALFGQSAGSAAAGIAGGAFGSLGFGAIGGILAKLAGIGKNADPTANLLLSTAGSLGGAALGAQFGFAGGGPIGAALGAIIGALASDAIPATPPRGFQSADFSSGTLRIRKGGKKGFDAGEMDPIVNQIIESLNEVDKALDLDLLKKNIKFFVGFHGDDRGFRANIGGKDVDFGKEAGASGRVQGAIFKEELLAALPDKERTKFQEKVLERAFATQNDTLKEQLTSIQKDIAVQEKLKAFVKVVNFDPRTEEIKRLKKEIQDLGRDFGKLRTEARELGLDTEKAEKAFKKTKRRIREEIRVEKLEGEAQKLEGEAQKIGVQQQAYQLAGQQVPYELQEAGLISQFKALDIAFRELGLQTSILARLLAEAVENLKENISIADEQAHLTAETRPYQLAGRPVPMELQAAAIRFEFARLGDQFRELGLDASGLSAFLLEALGNLQEAEQAARLGAQSRSYQLAGRQVPFRVQADLIWAEVQQLITQMPELAALFWENLLETYENLWEAQAEMQRGAISRAYQLAGQEVPKEIQIAGIQAEFTALGDLFVELGLDTGILAALLQSAIANVNKAASEAESGGFIGFLDEFGRIVESLPTRFDLSTPAANDPGEMIPSIPAFATGTRNRIVTQPELFLAGERGPESVNVSPLAGDGSSRGNVNIALNGPAIFDDITLAKFTRDISSQMRARQVRFG